MSDNKTDRRKFTRVPFHVAVLVECRGTILSAQTDNISMKGIHLSIPRADLPEQAPVDLTLRLQGDADQVKLRGTIVWQDQKGVAVQFDRIDYDAFLQLNRIVALVTGDGGEVVSELVHQIAGARLVP